MTYNENMGTSQTESTNRAGLGTDQSEEASTNVPTAVSENQPGITREDLSIFAQSLLNKTDQELALLLQDRLAQIHKFILQAPRSSHLLRKYLKQNGALAVEEELRRRPRGEVILGQTDPRKLSAQDFYQSPDRLYHGTSDPNFKLDRLYDYTSPDAMDHSQTVGEGFYTTDSEQDAQLFAQAFSANGSVNKVVEILPYQARMFDFRSQDKRVNAAVPEWFKQKYLDWYRNWHQVEHGYDYKDYQSPGSDGKFNRFQYSCYKYGLVLERLLNQDKVDLRALLSVTGKSGASQFASRIFREFMLSQGYDGLIYIEGGDHRDHKNPVSYVFFNLDKIGDYSAWHAGETTEINQT